jgi:UDP-3-O-[3-hydroxymyristoyl] glucosamine N-acyltransferase
VPAGKMMSGSPAFENRSWLRAVAVFQRLPELMRRLNHLERASTQASSQPDRGVTANALRKESND